jgi:hypothetical protein
VVWKRGCQWHGNFRGADGDNDFHADLRWYGRH